MVARHFGKLPEDLGPEQIREFQLWLIKVNQASWSQFNQAVCALRFLYTFTVARPWAVEMIPFGKRPKRLPTVLGQEEASAGQQRPAAPLTVASILRRYTEPFVHCPQCQGARRADWVDKTAQLLLTIVTTANLVGSLFWARVLRCVGSCGYVSLEYCSSRLAGAASA